MSVNVWLGLLTAALWIGVVVWYVRMEWRAAWMRLIDRLRGW